MKKLSPTLQRIALSEADRAALLADGTIMGYPVAPLHGNSGPQLDNDAAQRASAQRKAERAIARQFKQGAYA